MENAHMTQINYFTRWSTFKSIIRDNNVMILIYIITIWFMHMCVYFSAYVEWWDN